MRHPFDGSQLCAQVDPELFFPTTLQEVKASLEIVKPICKACPVFSSCLAYSKAHPELQGIWAGSFLKSQFYVSPVDLMKRAS